jgi:hypothetical protein
MKYFVAFFVLLSGFFAQSFAGKDCNVNFFDSFYKFPNDAQFITDGQEVDVSCKGEYFVNGNYGDTTFKTTCKNGQFIGYKVCKKKSCQNSLLVGLKNANATIETGTTLDGLSVTVNCMPGFYVENLGDQDKYQAVCVAESKAFVLKKCVKKCQDISMLGNLREVMYKNGDKFVPEDTCYNRLANGDYKIKSQCFIDTGRTVFFTCDKGYIPKESIDLPPSCPNGGVCFASSCWEDTLLSTNFCTLTPNPPASKSDQDLSQNVSCNPYFLKFISNNSQIKLFNASDVSLGDSAPVSGGGYAEITCQNTYFPLEGADTCSSKNANCFKTKCEAGAWQDVNVCAKRCDTSVFGISSAYNVEKMVNGQWVSQTETAVPYDTNQYKVTCLNSTNANDGSSSFVTKCQASGDFSVKKTCSSEAKPCLNRQIQFEEATIKPPVGFNASGNTASGDIIQGVCKTVSQIGPNALKCINGDWYSKFDGDVSEREKSTLASCREGCLIRNETDDDDTGFFRNGADQGNMQVLDGNGNRKYNPQLGQYLKNGEVLKVGCKFGYENKYNGDDYSGTYNACVDGQWVKPYVACVQQCEGYKMFDQASVSNHPKVMYSVGDMVESSQVRCNEDLQLFGEDAYFKFVKSYNYHPNAYFDSGGNALFPLNNPNSFYQHTESVSCKENKVDNLIKAVPSTQARCYRQCILSYGDSKVEFGEGLVGRIFLWYKHINEYCKDAPWSSTKPDQNCAQSYSYSKQKVARCDRDKAVLLLNNGADYAEKSVTFHDWGGCTDEDSAVDNGILARYDDIIQYKDMKNNPFHNFMNNGDYVLQVSKKGNDEWTHKYCGME